MIVSHPFRAPLESAAYLSSSADYAETLILLCKIMNSSWTIFNTSFMNGLQRPPGPYSNPYRFGGSSAKNVVSKKL